MSLKSKFFSVTALAAGVVVFSAVSFAQDDTKTTTMPTAPQNAERPFNKGQHGDGQFKGEGFRGQPGGPMGELRGLNLTDAQKAQIKSIMEANKPDKANFEQINAIREAHKNGTPITDEQKQQLKAFRDQSQAKEKAVHEQILGVLTAEQKAQLAQRKQEMKQKFEERRQHSTDKPAATDKPTIN